MADTFAWMPNELNITPAKAHLATSVYRGEGHSTTAAATVLNKARVRPPGGASEWYDYAVARAVQQHQKRENRELGWRAERI